MSTLAQARQGLADALSGVTGYDVRARPFSSPKKPGDGWVTVSRLAPSDFAHSSAVLTAVVVFGTDAIKAEERLENHGTALIDAVTSSDLLTADVSLEPVNLDPTAPLYGATLTVTLEVE